MFPEEDGDRFCLMCGERSYGWLGAFLDRLLDAMERQARRERKRDHALDAQVADSPGAERRRWDAAVDRQPPE